MNQMQLVMDNFEEKQIVHFTASVPFTTMWGLINLLSTYTLEGRVQVWYLLSCFPG